MYRLEERQESVQLRRKLEEVNAKFVQLQQAFVMKLRSQKHRETRFDRLTLENQEIQRFAEECLRDVTEMRIRLKETESERDLWKSTAMRERKKTERTRSEVKVAEESLEKKRESVSRGIRNEEREKQLEELSGFYDEAKEKIRRLEEERKENATRKESFEARARELANLLETLEHFDLDVKTLCRLTAEGEFDPRFYKFLKLPPVAVENLTKVGLHFAETIKKLRQFTWKADDKECDNETDKLRSQNLVLREIVKSLKRKAQFRSENQVSKDLRETIDERENKIEESCNYRDLKANDNNANVKKNRNQTRTEHEANSKGIDDVKNVVNDTSFENDFKENPTVINDRTESKEKCSSTRYNRDGKEIVSNDVDEKLLCIESHKNGIFYDEYVIGFSNNRQMKIKHSPEASTKTAHLKLEIVDCEEKYQESSPDKVVIFLKNLSTSIKIKHTGINCSTQTVLTRKRDNYTQTSITEIRNFLRLNVGYTLVSLFSRKASSIKQMLNSEKRAIERNLSSLEQTVARLKCNTLRSMIGKNSKCLRNDEFFEIN
ncbi:trichohyalin-like [Vespula squamosa]|uniref:Trichohyalin-like n=1 Tax=Vespula squamosa TaxID=30214 RepID=A0ABD2B1F9_VESSQ